MDRQPLHSISCFWTQSWPKNRLEYISIRKLLSTSWKKSLSLFVSQVNWACNLISSNYSPADRVLCVLIENRTNKIWGNKSRPALKFSEISAIFRGNFVFTCNFDWKIWPWWYNNQFWTLWSAAENVSWSNSGCRYQTSNLNLNNHEDLQWSRNKKKTEVHRQSLFNLNMEEEIVNWKQPTHVIFFSIKSEGKQAPEGLLISVVQDYRVYNVNHLPLV